MKICVHMTLDKKEMKKLNLIKKSGKYIGLPGDIVSSEYIINTPAQIRFKICLDNSGFHKVK